MHILQALMIMVEEAFWAGDHAAQGALKDMITADTIQNEDKGRRAFEAPDYSRQMHFSQPGKIILLRRTVMSAGSLSYSSEDHANQG